MKKSAQYRIIQCDLQNKILNETFRPLDKLPSIRSLSKQYGVTPNTMHRAILELMREGLLYYSRAAGYFVVGDIKIIEDNKEQKVLTLINDLYMVMSSMGYGKPETTELIKKYAI